MGQGGRWSGSKRSMGIVSVDAAFWSEPINAVTNAAFLIAALWAWRRPDLPVMGRVLNAVMLAWMIEVYRRHMLAGRRAKR